MRVAYHHHIVVAVVAVAVLIYPYHVAGTGFVVAVDECIAVVPVAVYLLLVLENALAGDAREVAYGEAHAGLISVVLRYVLRNHVGSAMDNTVGIVDGGDLVGVGGHIHAHAVIEVA